MFLTDSKNIDTDPLNCAELLCTRFSKTVPVLPSLDPSLIFPFYLIPSPVDLTGFSFCFFPGFLAIYILLSANNNWFVQNFITGAQTKDMLFWGNPGNHFCRPTLIERKGKVIKRKGKEERKKEEEIKRKKINLSRKRKVCDNFFFAPIFMNILFHTLKKILRKRKKTCPWTVFFTE